MCLAVLNELNDSLAAADRKDASAIERKLGTICRKYDNTDTRHRKAVRLCRQQCPEGQPRIISGLCLWRRRHAKGWTLSCRQTSLIGIIAFALAVLLLGACAARDLVADEQRCADGSVVPATQEEEPQPVLLAIRRQGGSRPQVGALLTGCPLIRAPEQASSGLILTWGHGRRT